MGSCARRLSLRRHHQHGTSAHDSNHHVYSSRHRCSHHVAETEYRALHIEGIEAPVAAMVGRRWEFVVVCRHLVGRQEGVGSDESNTTTLVVCSQQ